MGLPNLKFRVNEPLYNPNGGTMKQLLSDSYQDYFVEGVFDKFLGHQNIEDYPIDISRACDLEVILLTLILCAMSDDVCATLHTPNKDFIASSRNIPDFLRRFDQQYNKQLRRYYNSDIPSVSTSIITSSETKVKKLIEMFDAWKVCEHNFAIFYLNDLSIDSDMRERIIQKYCYVHKVSYAIIREV